MAQTTDAALNPAQSMHCFVYAGDTEPQSLAKLEHISDVLLDNQTFVWLDVVDPKPHDFALIEKSLPYTR